MILVPSGVQLRVAAPARRGLQPRLWEAAGSLQPRSGRGLQSLVVAWRARYLISVPRSLSSALQHLVTESPAASPQDYQGWWELECALRSAWPDPRLRALILAAASDRLAFAFSAGFRAALSTLIGDVDPRGERRFAFCATEEGGAHPRAIHTSLQQAGSEYRLVGKKRWATLGEHAEELLVIARVGELDGRPQLKLVRVGVEAPGVTRGSVQEAPFCPELSHASFEFDTRVSASALLPGDGYADYLKPFRTCEDSHVQLALNAYLLGVCLRYRLGAEWVERWSAQLLSCWALCDLDARNQAGHLALAGVMHQTQQMLSEFEAEWSKVDSAERERWLRDRALLQVASKARALRQEAARGALLQPQKSPPAAT